MTRRPGLTRPRITISFEEFLRDPALLGPAFSGMSWDAWKVFARALPGQDLRGAELDLYRTCTERHAAPTAPVKEAWVIAGRRAGKSRFTAALVTYLATIPDYTEVVAPGERPTVMLLAADREQARVLLRYIKGFFRQSRLLARRIGRVTRDAIELTTGVVIQVQTASFRSVRGHTVVAAVCDELAYWRNERSANPDVEVLAALRPAMATIPQPLLVIISSPYARRGALWDAYQRHWRQDGDPVLMWRAPTLVMNPTLGPSIIREAYERDPAVARAEFGAEFRDDLELAFSWELLQAAVVAGRRELPPSANQRHEAFGDLSGGRQAAAVLAIGHQRDGRYVLDKLLVRRPPFNPLAVVAEWVPWLQRYNVSTVHGDDYAAEWPRQAFATHGIRYEVVQRAKSELYAQLLAQLASHTVELLDDPECLRELLALERRAGARGHDSIDHPPGGHDDIANAVAGVLTLPPRPGLQIYAFAWDPGGPVYRIGSR